ncbi:MAG TPA: glycosyltransferase, partial [Chthoniobacteraceae bacterium]|nr:glycosyltransferase [Chthoniobacteraceae bacterium]
MKITLLHYTSAPAVGGVETILAEHSRLFAAHGHEVEVICGEGAVGSNPAVSVVLAPEMQWNHPLMLRAQREISVDRFGENFAALKNALVERLGGLFEGRDVVFLHNVLTMPFQLGLTEALWELADRPGGPRFVAWVHDLPAANPDWAYRHLLAREPWAKLARRHPRIEYVAVSELRRAEFAALTGSDPRGCRVVPNGIDPVAQLGLTENVAALAAERALLERDIVLIHPARIL